MLTGEASQLAAKWDHFTEEYCFKKGKGLLIINLIKVKSGVGFSLVLLIWVLYNTDSIYTVYLCYVGLEEDNLNLMGKSLLSQNVQIKVTFILSLIWY